MEFSKFFIHHLVTSFHFCKISYVDVIPMSLVFFPIPFADLIHSRLPRITCFSVLHIKIEGAVFSLMRIKTNLHLCIKMSMGINKVMLLSSIS